MSNQCGQREEDTPVVLPALKPIIMLAFRERANMVQSLASLRTPISYELAWSISEAGIVPPPYTSRASHLISRGDSGL